MLRTIQILCILINYMVSNDHVNTWHGEMAEWSNAAVLKTVEGQTSQGSNPCLSATFLPGFFGHSGVLSESTLRLNLIGAT